MDRKLRKIYETREFILLNYSQKIEDSKLSDLSCYSLHNLQRIFKSLFNETTKSYQKRLKLENAYKQIIYTNDAISDIALGVGYGDLQSLSKAFKKQFGVYPSAAREKKEQLLVTGIENINVQEIHPVIIELKELKCYYSSINTFYNNMEIDDCWLDLLSKLGDLKDASYYGLIMDEPLITDEIKCRYDACIVSSNIDIDLPYKMIPSGRYAVFTHYGDYASIINTYDSIYAYWILNTNEIILDNAVLEKYIKHVDNCDREDDFMSEIYIPIK